MTPPKGLFEVALRVLNCLRDLELHEKGAVLGIVTTALQAEIKSTEIATLQQQAMQAAAVPAAVDEHYRA